MKILFDQGTRRPLRHSLAEHSVDTASERGRSDLANRNIAIMVLLSTAWPLIQQKVDAISAAVNDMGPGELKEIAI